MMRRRMMVWMGLIVLAACIGLTEAGLAKAVHQSESGKDLSSPDGSRRVSSQQGSASAAEAVTTDRLEKSFPSSDREFYSVRKGDTLSRIARTTGVSISELREINRLGKGGRLKIGQKLLLHRPSEREDLSGPDSLSELEEEDDGIDSEAFRADMEKRLKAGDALLGRWNNPEEPKLLVKVAMGFLGAPYRLGGSSVTGIDCSAFVKKIYQFFNITLPRTAFEQSHVGLRVARGELMEGDLLFFNTRRKLGHVGIYVGDDKFVHASSRKRGVRIDSLSTPYFDRRFVRAVRLKEIDDRL